MQNPSTRQTLQLEEGWRFHLGDVPSPVPNTHIAAYMANKAGWARGAARTNFDDSDWRIVDLPHDWSVEGEFNPDNHLDSGFLPRGIAWYRRHFRLDESDRGNHLSLRFDGIASYCTVFVNGHVLHRHFCGYTPMTIDISDVATFGDQLNVVAVRVDATFMEGWWYEGAGIYRHAWLITTNSIHIAPDGVFVRPARLSSSEWDVHVEATIENATDAETDVIMISEVRDTAGSVVATCARPARVPPSGARVVRDRLSVQNPELWSLHRPTLYSLRTEIRRCGTSVDERATTFGFRTIRFDAEQGFFLNDEPVKLKGTCNHQDHAGVGVAVPDSIHEFRIRRLKEMGCNAYRCAHNPPAPELLDACDRLGMLVMDENRTFGSSPEHLNQLRAMVRRDRNHPSVILWSICNEEAIQGTPASANIARAMQHFVRQLDSSRPVTAAVSGGILNDDAIGAVIEIMGINYQLPANDQYHAKRPGVPVLAAETHSTLATRGAYETDPKLFVFAGDDSEVASWGASARETWRFVSSRPFVAGMFAWTGFDYRGEPTPHAWPCVNSHFGILDTCGFAKDSFHLHRAFFTTEPFVEISPHWNWQGSGGKIIRVRAYTNGETVELFLNGRSLRRNVVDPIEMTSWDVPYESGRLEAIAYRGDGVVARQVVETTGPAAAVGLEIDRSFDAASIPADGEFALPITLFAMDAEGRRVPTANDHITFAIDGPAKLLGVGNGDPTCHEPDKGLSRSLFHGLAQAIVQTTRTAGEIRLTASSPNLKSGELIVKSTPTPGRPSVPLAQVRWFISDWRRSPITVDRPNLDHPIPDQDMNSWERIDPAQPQPAWTSGGFAIYRATFTPPKAMQSRGGVILVHQVFGKAEVFLNQAKVPSSQSASGELRIEFEPTADKLTMSVLIFAEMERAGIMRAVELIGR